MTHDSKRTLKKVAFMKRKVSVRWAMVVCVAVLYAHGLYGQQDASKMVGAQLTPDAAWRLDNGVLHLTGTGVFPTTMFGQQSSWNNYRNSFNSVVIDEGITAVGQNLFIGYKNITSLTIAESVKDLAINSFNSCKQLSTVEVKSATPPDINYAAFYKVNFKKAKLIVPAGAKATYEADILWNQFATITESALPAATQPAPVEKLAEPCTIHLMRSTNFVGGGRGVTVFLNGVEQKQKLGNGQTLVLETDCDQNVIFTKVGKMPVAARRFEAKAGGNVRINFSFFNGYMKVVDENPDE